MSSTNGVGELSGAGHAGHPVKANGLGDKTRPLRPKVRICSKGEKTHELLDMIRGNSSLSQVVHDGPFGPRKVVYSDHTATGVSLRCIEEFISAEVLSLYGNTHTTSTITSSVTTNFRHEARGIVRNAVRASEHDVVIFCGSGATTSVHKIVNALKLQGQIPPLVFIGPYEHHSNILPWRDAGFEVMTVAETSEGFLDLEHLELQLKVAVAKNPQRVLVGSFSVASNITGAVANDIAITVLMHKYGGLAVWDYSAAGPHVDIVMNPLDPENGGLAHKDAIFFSGHKFLGGPQTPGVLVMKKKVFVNEIPSGGGGGSVFFVTNNDHRYLQNAEYREEGGTPAIVESIRLGLVFRLKEAITAPVIISREQRFVNRALEAWKEISEVKILGNSSHPRLPIVSFLIEHKDSEYFLHYNFVVALLNDLFGIQSRGGCACAAPYAYRLLGIDEELAVKYENLLLEDRRLNRTHLRRYQEGSKYEIYRPGFTRISFAYYSTEEEVDFVIEAVKLIAQHGWKLLPIYSFDAEKGEFQHLSHNVERKWLSKAVFDGGGLSRLKKNETLGLSFSDCIAKAEETFAKAHEIARRLKRTDQRLVFEAFTHPFRWFLLPYEASILLERGSSEFKSQKPFDVKVYKSMDLGLYLKFTDTVLRQLMAHTDFSFPAPSPWGTEECEEPDEEIYQLSSRFQFLPLHESIGDPLEKPSGARGDGGFETCERGWGSQTSHAIAQVLEKNEEEITVNLESASLEINSLRSEDIDEISRSPSPVKLGSSCSFDSGIQETFGSPTRPATQDQKEGKTEGKAEGFKQDPIPHIETHLEDQGPQRNRNVEALTLQGFSSTAQDETSGSDSLAHAGDEEAPKTEEKSLLCKVKVKVMNKVPPVVDLAKVKWHSPPNKIFKPTIRALHDFSMIQDGDRVLVCLSGGKDSLTLLHTLRQVQFVLKSKNLNFDLGAVTVDPGSDAYNPRPLIPYMKALGVEYFYEEQAIMAEALAKGDDVRSICSYCSRMKRGRIYATARKNGYNVLAFGQHLDDLAESFVMSIFHNGFLRTIKASYAVKENDLRVIRPFVNIREETLRDFAESRGLPVIAENCPACFKEPKERHRVKQLLASQELLFPNLFGALRRAMLPLTSINKTGVESSNPSFLPGGEEEDE